jgi:hypothetical protein
MPERGVLESKISCVWSKTVNFAFVSIENAALLKRCYDKLSILGRGLEACGMSAALSLRCAPH